MSSQLGALIVILAKFSDFGVNAQNLHNSHSWINLKQFFSVLHAS